ncbi:MAG: EscU/YscU/HrcU family type III secretion system export apparatus switch protein [Firmicutes bacterium]|nr:EscU/YscU/HrcU family type III secretion system export apparatus switch protein [Bacillota bacterium]
MNKKDKIKKAAAIRYEKGDSVPKITAMGKGVIAEKIINTAKKNNIPFFKDDSLVETLLNLKLGSEIPTELYEIVAEILVFVCHIDKKRGEFNA